MENDILHRNPEHLAIVKLADLIDAILFIEHEGIGRHAQEVCLGLKEILAGKIEEATRLYPQYDWPLAELLLDTLLQNSLVGQIAFEKA